MGPYKALRGLTRPLGALQGPLAHYSMANGGSFAPAGFIQNRHYSMSTGGSLALARFIQNCHITQWQTVDLSHMLVSYKTITQWQTVDLSQMLDSYKLPDLQQLLLSRWQTLQLRCLKVGHHSSKQWDQVCPSKYFPGLTQGLPRNYKASNGPCKAL